ncbi:MAG: DUF58 domain-containing protein [Acidimicrobiales bacterium]
MTGRGLAVLAGALIALLAGRLLGLEDLYLVGAGVVLVCAIAWVYVRVQRPQVAATRRVIPSRVHAGASSRVELSLTNLGSRRSPVLGVSDPFDGGARWARFLTAPLAPAELARAAYRLPTEVRGVFDLGPLRVALTDPFGLASRSVEAAPLTRLTVFPRIDRIGPPPASNGDDPLAGADHPRGFTGGGGEFYALRPYRRGDDLRKVHWPSTARSDDLMLRQDEMNWQSRSSLIVDLRAPACPPPALELVVSAAASIVVAADAHGGLQRIVTTAGFDSRAGAGTVHTETILEHLAGVRSGSGGLAGALGALRRTQGGGSLVIVTTALAGSSDLQALTGLRSRYTGVTLVLFEPSAWLAAGRTAGDPPLVPAARGLRVVRVTGDRPFAQAWGAAIERTGALRS